MINVLLVDDHDIIIEGVKSLLMEQEGISVVGTANSGEKAIQLAKEVSPDVVLMDVKMPGIGGLEATRKLRNNPDIKVIVLTIYGEEPFPTKLLQAGAEGYLTKGCDVSEMINAIRTVYNGRKFIGSDIAQQLALKNVDDQEGSPFDSLSDRELQVVLMILNGDKVQTISERLCLSPKTISSYRYRIYEKLKVSNDVDLTRLAIRHGVLDAETA